MDSDELSPAIVGTDSFDRWLKKCPSPLPDSLQIPMNEIEQDYFQNSWGAFGQYYRGSAEELGIIGRIENVPALASPSGPQLAVAFKRCADEANFPGVLKEEELKVSHLRRLGTLFAFNRPSIEERDLLRDALFDPDAIPGSSGARRRDSLLLLLSVAHQLVGPLEDPAWSVLKAALYGSITATVPFACPPPLVKHLNLWRVYALHELFAFAMESFLVLTVEKVGEREMDSLGPARSVDEVSKSISRLLPQEVGRRTFGDLVRETATTVQQGAEDTAQKEFVEVELRSQTIEALKAGDFSVAAASTLRLLIRIAAHLLGVRSTYGLFAPETTVDRERIGLETLARVAEERANQDAFGATAYLISLAANTHLRVATAKLAYNNDFTYKIAFESGLLHKVSETETAFSRPRLWTAAQLSADLDLLKQTSDGFLITQDGVSTLRRYGCLS